jgi:hypothetical protein
MSSDHDERERLKVLAISHNTMLDQRCRKCFT